MSKDNNRKPIVVICDDNTVGKYIDAVINPRQDDNEEVIHISRKFREPIYPRIPTSFGEGTYMFRHPISINYPESVCNALESIVHDTTDPDKNVVIIDRKFHKPLPFTSDSFATRVMDAMNDYKVGDYIDKAANLNASEDDDVILINRKFKPSFTNARATADKYPMNKNVLHKIIIMMYNYDAKKYANPDIKDYICKDLELAPEIYDEVMAEEIKVSNTDTTDVKEWLSELMNTLTNNDIGNIEKAAEKMGMTTEDFNDVMKDIKASLSSHNILACMKKESDTSEE